MNRAIHVIESRGWKLKTVDVSNYAAETLIEVLLSGESAAACGPVSRAAAGRFPYGKSGSWVSGGLRVVGRIAVVPQMPVHEVDVPRSYVAVSIKIPPVAQGIRGTPAVDDRVRTVPDEALGSRSTVQLNVDVGCRDVRECLPRGVLEHDLDARVVGKAGPSLIVGASPKETSCQSALGGRPNGSRLRYVERKGGRGLRDGGCSA